MSKIRATSFKLLCRILRNGCSTKSCEWFEARYGIRVRQFHCVLSSMADLAAWRRCRQAPPNQTPVVETKPGELDKSADKSLTAATGSPTNVGGRKL